MYKMYIIIYNRNNAAAAASTSSRRTKTRGQAVFTVTVAAEPDHNIVTTFAASTASCKTQKNKVHILLQKRGRRRRRYDSLRGLGDGLLR